MLPHQVRNRLIGHIPSRTSKFSHNNDYQFLIIVSHFIRIAIAPTIIMASCALDEYLAGLQISSSDLSIEKTKFILVDDNMKITPDFLVASKRRSRRGLNRTHSLPTVSRRWVHTSESDSDDQSSLHSRRKNQVLNRCRWDDFTSDCTGTTKNKNNPKNKSARLPLRRSHDQFVSLPMRSREEDLGCDREWTDLSCHQDPREELGTPSQNLEVLVRGGRNHHHQQQPAVRKTIPASSSGRSLSHYP